MVNRLNPPIRNSHTTPDSPVDRTLFERAALQRGCLRVAGVDEAGRGPLAGPVVAAAVILPPGSFIPGLRDSKKLTSRQREAFFGRIYELALGVGIGVVGEKEIDRINILRATMEAMKTALEKLPVAPDHVLIDALTLPDLPFPQQAIIRGDDYSLSIAGASVVAKVTRDRMMMEYDRRYPQYRFGAHKGYGTREHLEALRRFGPCPIHRRSFRPVQPPDAPRAS